MHYHTVHIGNILNTRHAKMVSPHFFFRLRGFGLCILSKLVVEKYSTIFNFCLFTCVWIFLFFAKKQCENNHTLARVSLYMYMYVCVNMCVCVNMFGSIESGSPVFRNCKSRRNVMFLQIAHTYKHTHIKCIVYLWFVYFY